jgi:hypothetical protein
MCFTFPEQKDKSLFIYCSFLLDRKKPEVFKDLDVI